jgi:hypothetical protein
MATEQGRGRGARQRIRILFVASPCVPIHPKKGTEQMTVAVERDKRAARRRGCQALIEQALRHGLEMPDTMPKASWTSLPDSP